jgi:hypothetical protein
VNVLAKEYRTTVKLCPEEGKALTCREGHRTMRLTPFVSSFAVPKPDYLQRDPAVIRTHKKTARSHQTVCIFTKYNGLVQPRGRDSPVGIATGYGLDGPGIESRCGRDLSHTSRPALRPTQPPVQLVPGLSRG